MNDNPEIMCIDAGGENCPCSLADSGNCIICGRLSGGDCSDCKWHGVCIYNEYIQNGRKTRNNRKDFFVKIVSRKMFDDNTVIFEIKTGKGFAVKCSSPGSYIFLRAKGREQYYNVPISVLDVDIENGTLFLLIKCISAKTKSLLDADDYLIIRGPYKNGIIGLEKIYEMVKSNKNKGIKNRVIIAARGTGIAPALRLLSFFGENVDFSLYFDPVNIPEDILINIQNRSEKRYIKNFENSEHISEIKSDIAYGDYDCFCIFASDYFINMFYEMSGDIEYDGKIVISNNFNICCGEGVCGACSVASKDGDTLKMCKCKLSGEAVLKRRVIFE